MGNRLLQRVKGALHLKIDKCQQQKFTNCSLCWIETKTRKSWNQFQPAKSFEDLSQLVAIYMQPKLIKCGHFFQRYQEFEGALSKLRMILDWRKMRVPLRNDKGKSLAPVFYGKLKSEYCRFVRPHFWQMTAFCRSISIRR